MDTNIFEGVEGKLKLKPLFNQLNSKYFGGAVPTCKLAWSGRLKRAIGLAQVKWVGQTVQRSKFDKYRDTIPQVDAKINMSSLKITIATGNDLTENDVIAILLHEMVHILLFSQRKLSGHHGTGEFDGWIKKLRKESGLEVPLKESSFKRSPKVSAKKGYVGLIYTRAGVGACTFTQKLVYSDEFESTLERFVNYSMKITGIQVYYASSPLVGQVPSKRTLRSMSWSDNVEKNDIEQIKKGKIVFDYIKRR